MKLNDTGKKVIRYVKRKINAQENYRALYSAIGNQNVIGRHPLSIQIQTISACNASCYFCPYHESWQKTNPGRMTDELYNKIINEISIYKIAKFCPYLENEPLVDSEIFKRIEFALSKINFQLLELSTNASLLNTQKLNELVEIFSKVKHQIYISFHGINSETYSAIMGLDFNKSKNNILSLIEKSQDNNLNIIIRGAGVARTQKNKMPQWFTENDYRKFWNMELNKHGFKKLPEIKFFTYHDRAGQIQRNEINFSKIIRPDLEGFYCHRVDQWLHFLYSGELILCCMDYQRETSFGNIANNILDEIINSETFLNLAKQTIGKKTSSPNYICKKCISPWDGEYTP